MTVDLSTARVGSEVTTHAKAKLVIERCEPNEWGIKFWFSGYTGWFIYQPDGAMSHAPRPNPMDIIAISPSVALTIEPRRLTYVRLIGEIQHALNEALSEEAKKRGLTQAEMARMLGKHKSFISRVMSGSSNMTLDTLADLAWALNRPVRITLLARDVLSVPDAC